MSDDEAVGTDTPEYEETRPRVDDLRDQVRQAQADRIAEQRSGETAYRTERLLAEEAELTAELERLTAPVEVPEDTVVDEDDPNRVYSTPDESSPYDVGAVSAEKPSEVDKATAPPSEEAKAANARRGGATTPTDSTPSGDTTKTPEV